MTTTAPAEPTSSLDTGTYEVLRRRLGEQAAGLARAAEALNTRRLEVFGSSELALIGTERIRTEHNCVPRDVVSVGGLMLFGYNVFIGLKAETSVADVFSAYSFDHDGEAFRFEPAEADFLADPTFQRDFAELYRYYRDTRLLQLRTVEGRLLAVFQIGANTEDIRVLRWEVRTDGAVSYLDNLGERDHVFPPSHDFEWTETTREHHVLGRHPHISIDDEVFVETVGGDLTVKIENNTETGEGIYAEPVDAPSQSLADGDIHYARIGTLILLRIRPYNEQAWRYLVFNTRTRTVVRLDGIGHACRQLPEDQGIIFPGGYYLATGVSKVFDGEVDGLEFERAIRSANGEDVLYVFYSRAEGRTLLLPYNVIRKTVATPLSCFGYSLFDDGTLVVSRANTDEPTRVHPMQVWRTPYLSDAAIAAQPAGTGPLERIGNADLVRGVSECLSVAAMVEEMAPSVPVFEGLISTCTRVFDQFHWLGELELRGPLSDVRATAEQVLDEFETVQELTDQAAAALEETRAKVTSLIGQAAGEAPRNADAWVRLLADLRAAQGRLVTLRDLRYMDLAGVDDLVERLGESQTDTARRAVAFLSREDAFTDYHRDIEALASRSEGIRTAAEMKPVLDQLAEQTSGLEVLTEVVSSLDTADATVRTGILERIGEVLAAINRARAGIDAARRQFLATEGRAEFAAEFALFGQAVTGALAVADTPESCDDQLGRLMLRLENLESRFGEFDDFLTEIGAKRTDVYEAFSSRKQALLDDRARRADRLVTSAERTLAGVRRRVATLGSPDEINTYFASDPMVAKVRSVAEELRALGDVRADELDGAVLAARQEAGRSLRDRLDLFDGDTIRFGRHRFTVTQESLDLTLVPKNGEMYFSLTGTDYLDPVRDSAFAQARPFWDQLIVSETAEVYRAEYLAASILAGPEPLGSDLLAVVRTAAESRYDEGYERGVHDHDAAALLDCLVRLTASAGVLRFPASTRAAAQLHWAYRLDDGQRESWTRRCTSLARARSVFGHGVGIDEVCGELASAVGDELAGEYLFEELSSGPPGFAASAGARALLDRFHTALVGRTEYDDDLRSLGDDLAARTQLVESWLGSYLASVGTTEEQRAVLPEAIAVELCPDLPRYDLSATLTGTVEGLLGTHPRIVDRRIDVRIDEFLARTRRFRLERVPAFRTYQRQRDALLTAKRDQLKLDEFRPKVMSAFVRNRLLDEVYLPLIGDNLAKQLGAAGDERRTDQMGLLLLISPPGYGKTTLMEYVANRLGLVFVKVNGPSLGHDVTSLDPAEAPNATARHEVEKISLALEMGNNVLLYLDDIQHTSPELLQKFISLCDAQRRIEGVRAGEPHTFDLRGKRFAVCMAGNPYTESGQRFRIPDMLANRADVWNLGDVLSGREELFALSYIENALTSNPVLAPLSGGDRGDIELLVRLAAGDSSARADRLSRPFSAAELEQLLSVLRKVLTVQKVVLRNNQAYIASAAQSDAGRTEPPFLLQGSYRNMNKLAGRIVPVMNDAELDGVIDDHYRGEAQTLTSGAEANLLKLAELRGRLTPEQARRWAEVKAAFVRAQTLGGAEDDPMSRAVGAVGLLADRVSTAIDRAAEHLGPTSS
ncbi:DNA repair ATPase [Pseudonocardia spinosispora]|uniref:DNA repair ATPase n=1 Tax=Pseudonocardia spinosispora TaxID=103441 RepID=UPI000427702B|nr:DNA repair ATPase [Pseudonocardia spinosispora]